MGSKLRIALIYSYNENWIGGTYYIHNLIKSLNFLAEKKQPDIFVLTESYEQFFSLKDVTGYRKLFYLNPIIKLSIIKRTINKFFSFFTKRIFFESYYEGVDVFFPAFFSTNFKKSTRLLFWIPDFQEHFLKHLFTEEDFLARKQFQERVLQDGKFIVFSSLAAQRDFNHIYAYNSIKQFVLPFAVVHSKDYISSKDVLNKYGISEPYFICSNQFWQHKNQKIIIEALLLLLKYGMRVRVVFTGKEYDYRNPEYYEEFVELVKENNLQESISILGFIDRDDQLCLMQHCKAIIQPSFFEGWSTVVEDAKSLNVKIIASDIEVHREQLLNYNSKLLFNPGDEKALANCIEEIENLPLKKYNYSTDVEKFANVFLNIIDALK